MPIVDLNFGDVHYGGDSFLASLLLNAFGAFLGFGFALIIYYKTLRSDKQKEKQNESNQRADELKYFQHLLEGSISHIENLYDSLKIYIQKQREDLLDLKTLQFKVNNDINRINSQDSLNIFLAYRHFMSLEPDWINDYRRIYNSIDLILEIELEVKRLYKYHLEDSYKKGLKAKDIIDKLPDRMASYTHEIGKELGEKRLKNKGFQFLEKELVAHHERVERGVSLSEMNDNYLTLIIDELVKNHKDEIFLYELVLMCKNARMMMGDLKRDISSFLNDMEQIPNNSKPLLDRIKLANDKIKNTLGNLS